MKGKGKGKRMAKNTGTLDNHSSPAQVNNLGSISSVKGKGEAIAQNTGTLDNRYSRNPECSSFSDTLHDPPTYSNIFTGMSTHWSIEEQEILRLGLVEHENECSTLKYFKIAKLLPAKKVRDVTMRCRWMTENEQGKLIKPKRHYISKKNKGPKEMESAHRSYQVHPENIATCSHQVADVNPSYQMNTIIFQGMANDHCIQPVDSMPYFLPVPNMHQSYQAQNEDPAIDAQRLFDENDQILNQLERNIAAGEIQDNYDLFNRVEVNVEALRQIYIN